MSQIALNLVVIRSSDLEKSQRFYHALGLNFAVERHGSGPEHLVAELGDAIFEIYPRGQGIAPGDTTRLGFRVPSVDLAVAELDQVGAEIRVQPHDSPWGRRAVACDPDGYRIEIGE